MATPILTGKRFLVVIEFFTDRRLDREQSLLDMLREVVRRAGDPNRVTNIRLDWGRKFGVAVYGLRGGSRHDNECDKQESNMRHVLAWARHLLLRIMLGFRESVPQ